VLQARYCFCAAMLRTARSSLRVVVFTSTCVMQDAKAASMLDGCSPCTRCTVSCRPGDPSAASARSDSAAPAASRVLTRLSCSRCLQFPNTARLLLLTWHPCRCSATMPCSSGRWRAASGSRCMFCKEAEDRTVRSLFENRVCNHMAPTWSLKSTTRPKSWLLDTTGSAA
jgi:hypothetical protein